MEVISPLNHSMLGDEWADVRQDSVRDCPKAMVWSVSSSAKEGAEKEENFREHRSVRQEADT